jgi:chitin synthase
MIQLNHLTLPLLLSAVPEFIGQRRRWLNGSFFAAIHATVVRPLSTGLFLPWHLRIAVLTDFRHVQFFFKIWTSGQGFIRKIVLQLELIFMTVQLIFSFFSISSYYLACESLELRA